jgi:hypothetical protein
LSDWISSLVPPLLRDERRPANVRDNLDHPGDDGQTRSRFEPSKPFSVYTGANLHPGLALGLVLSLGLGALAAARAGRPRF